MLSTWTSSWMHLYIDCTSSHISKKCSPYLVYHYRLPIMNLSIAKMCGILWLFTWTITIFLKNYGAHNYWLKVEWVVGWESLLHIVSVDTCLRNFPGNKDAWKSGPRNFIFLIGSEESTLLKINPLHPWVLDEVYIYTYSHTHIHQFQFQVFSSKIAISSKILKYCDIIC